MSLEFVERLRLAPTGGAAFSSLGGNEAALERFKVVVLVRPLHPCELTVAAHPDESLILLGRDYLNQFKEKLDGPAIRVEISDN